MPKPQPLNETPHTSRREFLKAAGVGGTAATLGVSTLSVNVAQAETFDAEYDIVVVGGGGGGLPAALFSRWLGNKVVILEKAGELGGTAIKQLSGTGCRTTTDAGSGHHGRRNRTSSAMWHGCRARSLTTADHPRFGLSEWEYDDVRGDLRQRLACSRIAARERRARHIVTSLRCPITGRKFPRTRRRPAACCCRRMRPKMSDGGRVAIRTMSAAAKRDGVNIRTGHRVQRVIRATRCAVIGVEAQTEGGGQARRARAKR